MAKRETKIATSDGNKQGGEKPLRQTQQSQQNQGQGNQSNQGTK
ncbi:MAG TPA: hypothetical protein VGE45_01725 [Chloroflexia bacterium]